MGKGAILNKKWLKGTKPDRVEFICLRWFSILARASHFY